MTRIAIDAGHAISTAGKRTCDGYQEHIINVKTAYACEQYLKANGIETIRVAWNDTNAKDDYTDISLTDRQRAIKNAKCDYSVSCHANASGDGKTWNSASGVDTFYHSNTAKAGDSKKLADYVQKRLIQGTPQSNRGIKGQAFAMCNCAATGCKASILCEIAFMTNQKEADLMKGEAFCKEQGEDIAKGIIDYLKAKGEFNPVTTPTPVPTTPSITYKPNTVLSCTATIKGVQEYLNKYYGSYIEKVIGAKLSVDGKLTTNMKKCLAIAFQVELNALGARLSTDGSFGPASETAFNKYVGSLKTGSKGIFVTLWQCLLVGFGYDPRGIDGSMGTGTKNATDKLCAAKGLPRDYVVNGSDLNKLL